MEGAIEELCVVFVVVVGEVLQLSFGKYAESRVSTVVILSPLVSPSCYVHLHQFLLLLFAAIGEGLVISFGHFPLGLGNTARTIAG